MSLGTRKLLAALCCAVLLCASLPGRAQEEPAQEPEAVATIPVETRTAPEKLDEAEPASSDGAAFLDTIEVTATRRAKQQRDIPGSVGALRGETLEKIGAQSMKDYLKLVPGVQLNEGGTVVDSNIPIIRGIGTAIGFNNAGLPTGVYVDDLPFTDLALPLSVPDVNPFDLERVEILKGPQGTLFGAGALAGAVRFVLNKPQYGVWEGKFQQNFTQSQVGALSTATGGALNVPLGNSAAIRAVGHYRRDGGTTDDLNRGEQDTDKIRQNTWRVLGSWTPLERLTLTGFYFSQETNQADLGATTRPNEFVREGFPPFAQPSLSALTGANVQAGYDFDWGRILLSTNRVSKDVRRYSAGFPLGSTLPPPQFREPECQTSCDIGGEDQNITPVITSLFTGRLKGAFHELRLSSPDDSDGPWEWLVGAAYLDYNQHIKLLGVRLAPEGTLPVVPETMLGSPTSLLATADSDIFHFPKEKSVFGEATRAIGEHWELTAGGRLYQITSTSDYRRRGAEAPLFPREDGLPTPSFEARRNLTHNERGFNPKLALRYKHNSHIQVYLLAAKGFQFGGPQFQPPAAAQGNLTELRGGFEPDFFKSSKLWNYEIGLRTEWLERRLRFDIVGFYLDWKDLQLSQTIFVQPDESRENPVIAPTGAGTIGAFNVVGNIGSAHSEGIEVSLEIKPIPELTFTSAAAWISALLDEPYDAPEGTIPPGTRLPGTPRFAIANVLAYQYKTPFTDNWIGGAALTHSHTGVYYTNLLLDDPSGGYDTLDARLSLSGIGLRLRPEINLGLSNLTDVRGVAGQETNTRGTPVRIPGYNLIRPRTLLVSLAFKF